MENCTQPLWTHERIARQAAATPDSVALRGDEDRVTFLQLDQRANRLARHIQALGVGTETPVGLYFERSADFVVAALAVLKAGGAYVPLDPAYPPARIDAILKDANVPVLLSHRWMSANLHRGPWTTVDLEFDARAIDVHSGEALDVRVAGEDLAYVIYTSGSTGKPKGVEVTHANLLHLLEWHQRAFAVTAQDRASHIAGLAFDAAVWEIWCNLAAGASLHLIDEVSRRSPEALKDWLVAEQITIAFLPTILAEYLMTFDWPRNTALRLLLTGADTLHRYPKADLPFALVNNYGPTECTVLVTSGVVSAAVETTMPSIGRPIDDTTILIMNEDGEICVAGPQVARGYRNLPELTAEKFILHEGRRLYRTGDRGRILPDGQIAFLGRIDDQIKIRGFRVEPDEVSAQINRIPGVLSSVVIARGDKADEKVLVAYVVCDASLTAAQIRGYLRPRLPDYMIPSAYVRLVSLPVTLAGKCDKQALPAPDAANLLSDSFEKKTSTQSETELRIAQLVSGVMDGRPVGRDDNFFLIGGHSMMAAQLIARVRETFAVSLTLRQLFEAPTIAGLASVVDLKLVAQ